MGLVAFVILASGLVSVAITPVAKRLAFAVGALDHPGGRRNVHERQVARLGGVAVFVPVVLSIVLGFWIVPEGSRRLGSTELLGLLVAGGCIFLLGIYDDIRGANAPVKLTFQISAAAILYFSNVRISEVWTPIGWIVTLGVLALPITVLWLVGLTNGMNLLDGIDGLAAGVGAIGSLTILIISIGQGNTQVSLMAAALLGGLLGFLVFNFHPAQIFLGDCGALFLGFFLAAISILGNQKSASAVALGIPIVALGIPIFDTALAFFRRVLRGKHPFQADRDHLHHRLLALGLSQPEVAITLYAVSGILAAIALLMTNTTRTVGAMILLSLGLVVVAVIRRLWEGEFRELSRLLVYGERRRDTPRNRAMLVRNTVPMLARCETEAALRAHLEDLRKGLEFETLQICFKAEAAPKILNGATVFTLKHTTSAADTELSFPKGEAQWTGRTEIIGEMRNEESKGNAECGTPSGYPNSEGGGKVERRAQNSPGRREGRVVGEVVATKPAWKLRRASERDEELLQWLADGIAKWIDGQNGLPNHLKSRWAWRPRWYKAADLR